MITKKAIVFDGRKWYVRRIRVIEHDLERDEKVYRCDKAISNDHPVLSEVPEVKSLLVMAVEFQRPRIETLEIALRESLHLRSHYADLLNMHDGGKRIAFATPDTWIARLRKTGALKK